MLGLNFMKGIGRQVKNTVINRKNFLPQRSLKAPISGALKNERNPFTPIIRPFMRNVWSGKVVFRTVIAGKVNRPHAKNSRKMTTIACNNDGLDRTADIRLLLTKEVRLPVLIIALTIRFDPMFRDDVSSVCSSTFCSIDSSTSLFLHTVEGWEFVCI